MGQSIYKLTGYGPLLLEKIVEHAHAEPVATMAYAGDGRVWSCTTAGEVCVWDTHGGMQGRFWLPHACIYSLCAVDMFGTSTMWIGDAPSIA